MAAPQPDFLDLSKALSSPWGAKGPRGPAGPCCKAAGLQGFTPRQRVTPTLLSLGPDLREPPARPGTDVPSLSAPRTFRPGDLGAGVAFLVTQAGLCNPGGGVVP